MSGISWWSGASLEARQALCDRLEWPQQYAEGEADHEWLTDEQYAELASVPLDWLDQADSMAEANG